MRRPSLTRRILRGIIAATNLASREEFYQTATQTSDDIAAAKEFAARFHKWQCHQAVLREQEKQGGKS